MNNDFIELNDIDILEVAKPLKDKISLLLSNIKDKILLVPGFIRTVSSFIPIKNLQAVLTNEQKEKIASGVLKIMSKNDGTLVANLVDAQSGKIVTNIPLKEIKLTPELNKAMTDFALQLQLLQISAEIKSIKKAVEEVRKGQEYDRLATAYSCQQKFLQATLIKDIKLKKETLLRIALDAEDSRNFLMLSQKANIDFIKNLPDGYWKKMLSLTTSSEIDSRMNEIREGFSTINMVSLIEALAYHELEEYGSEQQSLIYYADFIQKTYLDDSKLLKRLDSIDPSTERYWTTKVPIIETKIRKQKELYNKLELLEVK
ncbi:hypothetical protein [Fusobacterium nucleatum]|nr:hypothetical protein [Fusobacterium nucleatum]MCL4575346.1 hypothetical protein [Fusobacterium nucleatum YWH7056]MCL4582912.1 hypothetical protein [Fusobacterium nucleatum YWH7054]MCL4592026.1 hypothetical protein [Fusobacterium nucleatum YWH7053]